MDDKKRKHKMKYVSYAEIKEAVSSEKIPPDMQATEETAFLDEARTLFLEYARSLPIDLSFQNFNEELKTLPERYGPPDGTIILAYAGGLRAGCAALHRLAGDICEMKRLYVRDDCRGLGIGKELIAKVLEAAAARGYRFIRLDTLPTMKQAQKLYEASGFYDIDPYVYNPLAEARFMEKKLY